ncbi:hypothetical protein C0J52_23756 [Blattella germanica]|nr:hypothetical protein C0J52_23756 [Blattella germanica]
MVALNKKVLSLAKHNMIFGYTDPVCLQSMGMSVNLVAFFTTGVDHNLEDVMVVYMVNIVVSNNNQYLYNFCLYMLLRGGKNTHTLLELVLHYQILFLRINKNEVLHRKKRKLKF